MLGLRHTRLYESLANRKYSHVMRFSVVIPLEFHRGIAEKCIASWAQSQTFSRGDFEIVIAAPEGHNPTELKRIAGLLSEYDVLLSIAAHHDMGLIAEGAKKARGEFLVFTESHVWAEGDFLEQADQVLREFPAWCGFSGRSIPITHNLLSEIEAEMYSRDISFNLQNHQWLKVLDQCFVISARDYHAVGGVEPEYGHFAEWLLAARLHRAGLIVGYDARPAIRHYYIGDLQDLEEFTLDFAQGQMLFARRSAEDRCGDLFDEVPQWVGRNERDPDVSSAMLRVLVCDFRGRVASLDFRGLARWPWSECAFWLSRRFSPSWIKTTLLKLRLSFTRVLTRRFLAKQNREASRKYFLRLMGLCVEFAREAFLASHCCKPAQFSSPVKNHSEWRAGRWEKLAATGLHGLERLETLNFRWSRPSAMLQLPYVPSPALVSIKWAFPPTQSVRFYVDGKLVRASRIRCPDALRTEISLPSGGAAKSLSWICLATSGANDERKLGLAVARVCVRPTTSKNISDREPAAEETIYFLHVPKCAGTTARILLVNSAPAGDCLAASAPEFYYKSQLRQSPLIHGGYSIAAGHFGWDLPAALNRRKWRICTLLRQPLSRLFSRHGYLIQTGALPATSNFGDWVEREIRLEDLSIPYFVPGSGNEEAKGLEIVGNLAAAMYDSAVINLRSCEAVGIQERMDASIDLFSWRFGFLPPLVVPRNNPRIHRPEAECSDLPEMQLLRTHLSSEFEFCDLASRIFGSQKREMEECLSSGADLTHGVRSALRRLYFQRAADNLPSRTPDRFAWTPEDVFVGSGLHQHEHHGGTWLRWTDGAAQTLFYAHLPVSHDCSVALRLHPATPAIHVRGCSVIINGTKVALSVGTAEDGYTLSGRVAPCPPPAECSPFSEIVIDSPAAFFAGDFRKLGVAITGLSLARA